MRRLVLLVIGVLVISGGTALAQDRGDVSAGYRFVRASDEGESVNFPKGWYFDVAGHVAPMISIVGEVGGNYKDFSGISFKVHTFQAGPRFRWSMVNPKAVPFVQVLFGGARGSGGGDSETNATVEFDGGVDAKANDQFGVRVLAGYAREFHEASDVNIFRFSVGAVFGF